MAFRVVAFHPKPAHHEEMVRRVADAAAVIRELAGCIDVDYWLDEASSAVVSTAKFDSKDDWLAAFDAVDAAGVDFAFDERELRPREIYNLVEAR